MDTEFGNEFEASYLMEEASLTLGGAMLDKKCLENAQVKLPLKYFNRHGLISGATGTGKTKSLQVLAEQLSLMGVPSLVMDIKGDLSGLAKASPGHPKITERHQAIGLGFSPQAFPVELLSLSQGEGAKLRATVSEFGPLLFSKILSLNETQTSVVSIVFKFCDDHKLALVDLEDFKTALNYMCNDAKEEVQSEYGSIATSSATAIIRKLIELEQQGADLFFGELSFDPDDLLKVNDQGMGQISILRLCDIQDKPHLFSTFMLGLLSEIYASFPEQGDSEKPKLVLFIDEAHLIFKEASKELLRQLDTVVKLIRSKGVGLYFITQDPDDVPENILGQLGLKIQHALRAFTAKDRKNIKLMSQNFPETKYYDVEALLTELGVGEALVSGLVKKGQPSLLVQTMMRAPLSRMDILSENEIQDLVRSSALVRKYSQKLDPESAHEILKKRIEDSDEKEEGGEKKPSKNKGKEEPSFFQSVFESSTFKSVATTLTRELTRGLLGSLGIKTTTRRTRRR